MAHFMGDEEVQKKPHGVHRESISAIGQEEGGEQLVQPKSRRSEKMNALLDE